MPARVLILRAAGTNCDAETAYAWQLAGAKAETIHVKRLMHDPALLRAFDVLTIPGGFSYGDDISAGTILANQLMQSAGDELLRFLEGGKLILGICNGFQVLVKTGLLPGPGVGSRVVTLSDNRSGSFESRWVRLRSGITACRFLPPGVMLELPVAHAQGRLLCRDDKVLQSLIHNHHVCLTYAGTGGQPCRYPDNPNGSDADIAGLTDTTGQILGLMPHPERFVTTFQHPLWTRRRVEGEPDGLTIFKTALASLGG
ncbi:MAG: phosphoribosylformylglycinamidine synthase I [Phycisphaerae bacterium]|nr:phosphoribosylformylglycinamidine synthase I [Phycisphaerae bacterium]